MSPKTSEDRAVIGWKLARIHGLLPASEIDVEEFIARTAGIENAKAVRVRLAKVGYDSYYDSERAEIGRKLAIAAGAL